MKWKKENKESTVPKYVCISCEEWRSWKEGRTQK